MDSAWTQMSFFSFLFFRFQSFFKLREREREGGYIKLGIRRNSPKVYLSFFAGFLWRIFLLLRALLLPGVLGFSSVRHEPCPTTDFLIIYFRWQKGVPTSVLGSQPLIWLLSSSPWSGDFFRATKCHPSPILFPSGHQVQTSVFPFSLGFVTLGLTHILSCLNGHSLMACQFKHEDCRNLISIFLAGHHVTV